MNTATIRLPASRCFAIYETVDGVERFFGNYTRRDMEAVLRIFARGNRVARVEGPGLESTAGA